MKRITTTILATLLAATAQLASAANPIDDSRRHVEVHFADLNLSTTEGAAALYRRLHSAAQNVCSEEGTKDLESVVRVKACVAAAVSAAVTQIDKPVLSAYYRANLAGANAAVLRASR
jgi:UrcA family protein